MTVSEHVYSASVGSTPLSVRGGSITLDSGQAPHVSATVEISLPGTWTTTEIDNPLHVPLEGALRLATIGDDQTVGIYPGGPADIDGDAAVGTYEVLGGSRLEALPDGMFAMPADLEGLPYLPPPTVTVPVWTPDPDALGDLDPRSSPAPRVSVTASTAKPSEAAAYEEDFDEGAPGWTGGHESTGYARSGQAYFNSQVGSSPVVLSRALSGLVAGRTYTLTAWLGTPRSASTVVHATLGIVGLAAPAEATLPPGVSGTITWQQRTYTFTATASEHTLEARAYSTGITGNAYLVIDDVSLVAYSRTFDLTLRDRTIDRLDGVVRLELASDEALLEDYAPMTDDAAPQALTTLRAVVNYVLGESIPGAALEAGSTGLDAPVDAEDSDEDALIWKAGEDALSFLHPLVQRAGLRLVCDEERRWTLRDETFEAPGSLLLRQGVNLVQAEEMISRDAGFWFDARVTRYRWTDAAGLQQERIDSYALTPSYSRLTLLEVSAPYPGPGRSEYAVRRAQGVGREVTVATVSDWTATAELGVSIILADTPPQLGKVQRVTFDLDNDEMTIAARTVDTPEGAINLLPGTINALTGTINDL